MKPFEIEGAIGNWRQELSAKGLDRTDLLDELENHLREDFEQQIRAGTDAQAAFESAALRIGNSAALKKEFGKIRAFSLFARSMRALLAFAGVPNHQLVTGMNDSSNPLEARWATYLRSAVFLAPALALWVLAAVFVIPRVNYIWTQMAVANHGADTKFDEILRFDNAIGNLAKDNLLLIAVGLVLLLGLMEWRFKFWPRFRRAFLGTGVFLLNLAILISLFIQFLSATLAASWLLPHVK